MNLFYRQDVRSRLHGIILFAAILVILTNAPAQASNVCNSPWQAPNYAHQNNAIGYAEDMFKASEAESAIVQFWIDIYTKYSTHEGVIHHSDYPEIVYESIDFSRIDNDESLSAAKKNQMREQMIRSAKERIQFALQKLSENANSANLNSYDKRIKDVFKGVANPPDYFASSDMRAIRFQLGQSNRMKEAIKISGRYLPNMEKIFKAEGLPIELTRIVFVESAFNVSSYSKVGASGLWQIMPNVAKGNLKMNSLVDYRNHPLEATRLAARILKYNFLNLGSWPLAITAYNHGVNGVKRLIELNNSKDLFKIIDTGSYTNTFGFASRNFYYSFLAALTVEKSAGDYYSDICRFSKLKVVEATLPKPLSYKKLVRLFNGDSQLAFSLNPHFQRGIYQNKSLMPRKAKVILPQGKLNDLHALVRGEEADSAADVSTENKIEEKYLVAKGDTLSAIAKKYRVSIDSLLVWNDLDHPNQVRTGQKLFIYR